MEEEEKKEVERGRRGVERGVEKRERRRAMVFFGLVLVFLVLVFGLCGKTLVN